MKFMYKNMARIIVLLVSWLSFTGLAWSQDTVTGAFEGTVTNSQSGEPIAAAEVALINQSTGLTFNRRSNAQGRFFQGLLAPGTYLIRVSAPGFVTQEVVQALKISFTGEVVPVPVTLEPATPGATPTPAPSPGTTPSATLPALIPTVNELRASIGGTDGAQRGSFSEKEATSLPLGGTTGTRTFDELATLLPGVAPPPQTQGSVAGPGQGSGVGTSGQFAVNGLRSRANNFTVDGSDNNDEDIGVRRQGFVSLVPQPIESIQEYQVISVLPPAQFGRNLGGQINAVSKSGGNDLHGNLYGFFNSSQLNARNFFDTANGRATTPLLAANGRAVRFRGQPLSVTNQSGGEDSLTFGQGGFTFGGPLRRSDAKNRAGVFFFTSLERAQQNATQEDNFAVPTVEQRGLQNSGASGLANDPLTGQPLPNCPAAPGTASGCAFPATLGGSFVFSLFPFPNNPNGIYGANIVIRGQDGAGVSAAMVALAKLFPA